MALMIAISAVAASLTMVPPPRAMRADGAVPLLAHPRGVVTLINTTVASGPYFVDVDATSTSQGESEIQIKYRDSSGNPYPVQRSRVSLSLPLKAIDGVEVPGEVVAPGVYRHATNALVIPGEWQLRVEGITGDFDSITADVPVRIL